jgi:hypothetical protein
LLLMKLKMQACHLWEAVEDDDVDFHDDRTALEAICSGLRSAPGDGAHPGDQAVSQGGVGGDLIDAHR